MTVEEMIAALSRQEANAYRYTSRSPYIDHVSYLIEALRRDLDRKSLDEARARRAAEIGHRRCYRPFDTRKAPA